MTTLWEEMLNNIVKEHENNPDTFLRQPTIRKTVHPDCQALATSYYREMKDSPFFNETILPKMKDSSVGNPYRFRILPQCSPLTVQHCYHLNIIKEKMGIFIPQEEINHIVEIGGGYGNLARLIKNFSYDGRYIIVDFAQMIAIQNENFKRNSVTDIEFSSLNMDQLIPKNNEGKSILIATFSINEMPMKTRKEIEPYYEKFDYLFFVFNAKFDGINNIEYFDNLGKLLSTTFDVETFKDKYKTSWFMVCKRRNTI